MFAAIQIRGDDLMQIVSSFDNHVPTLEVSERRNRGTVQIVENRIHALIVHANWGHPLVE